MASSEERRLSPGAKGYIAATVVAAVCALWWLAQRELVIGPVGAFLILAMLAIFVESLGLIFSYKGQMFQYSLGAPLMLAVMTVFGLAPAAIVQIAASLVSDVSRHKSWAKVAFNASQTTLSLTAAGTVIEGLLRERITYPGMTFEQAQLPILLLGLVAYFMVNNLLTAIIVQLVTGWRHLDVVKRFVSQESLIDAAGLLLVPVLAVSVQRNPLLVLLLIIPTAALYRATRLALENLQLLSDTAKAREEKLAAEKRFHSFVQNSSDMICLTDPAGQVVFTSASIRRIAGYAPHETPWLLFDRVHQDDHGQMSAALARVAASTDPITLPEIRFLHADGTVRWTEVVLSNMLKDDPVRGIVLNIRDISERRTLEAQLRQSQKLDALGQLAGSIAHDFNNLLSVVQGFARFARDAGPGDESYRDDLDEVLKTSERGVRLIRQLMLFSRSDVRQAELVDVNAVITDLLKLLRTTVTEGVELTFEPAASLPPMKIYPGGLEQLLINLAVNGRDAMQNKGTLRITTELVPADEKPASDDWLRLRVTDSGCGMDQATMDRIFEPFFTTKARGSGTGLGLATVHGIVNTAGGRISVTSSPGRGTTFVIDFPSAAGDPDAREPEPVAVPPGSTSQTVLVVEDDPALCAMVDRILSRAGYTVLATVAPEAALDLAGRHSGELALLLTDVVMPGITGPELAEKVLARSPRSRLLYMSGYTDDLIAAHDVETLLRKPFTPEELLVSVRKVLESS